MGYLGGSQSAPQIGPPGEEKTVTTTATTTITGGGPESVTLGSIHPLTGYDSSNGQEMHRGVELALKEINSMGGVLGRQVQWVELDIGDFTADTVLASVDTLATKHKVDFVVYGYCAIGDPTYRRFASHEIPFMHVETVTEFVDWVNNNPDKAWLGWMACAPERFYGAGFAVMLDKLIESGAWKPSTKTTAVVRGEDPYGQIIGAEYIKEITKRGWSVTVDDTVTYGTVEYGPILTKIRSNPPDVIFCTNYITSDYANLVKQFTDNPTNSLMYGTWAPAAPEFIELLGDKANGVIWSTLIGPLTRAGAQYQDPITKTWYDKYKAAYNAEPGDQGAICYDMTWMWATATSIAGTTDKRAVTDVLARMVYRGACGTYRFNKEHWPNPYPSIDRDPSIGLAHQYIQIQDGEHKVTSPEPYAAAQFQLPWWIKK